MNSILRRRMNYRVIVTLKTGVAFDGILWQHDRQALVLRSATAAGAGENGAPLPLDGEVLVLMADVDFIQRP